MPLYAGELNLRRGVALEEYPAPMSEVLRSQAEETAVHNPTSALRRLYDINAAERGEMIDPGDETTSPQYAPAKRVDAETARARVKEEGLPLTIPDEGIAEPALDILIRRKRAELQRQNVFSRGPSGVLPGAARLGVALVESLFDPLNIASAFVPVVGPARYTAMVAGATSSLGRAGVRFGVGAAEGAAGAALLEPLVYAAARAEQADYTMADSLLNVAFGGLFGGGLHVAGGAVRDVVQPGWWRLAERTDTPGAATPELGRTLDAAPEVSRVATRAADTVDAVEIARRVVEAERRPGFQRTADDLLVLRGAERTPEVERAIEILKQEPFARSAEDRVFLAALEKGHEADFINDRVTAGLRQLDAIDQQFLARGNSPESEAAVAAKQEVTQRMDRDVSRLAALGRSVNEARLVMDRVSPETRAAALKTAVVQAAEGRLTEVDAVVRMDAAARPGTAITTQQAFADASAAAQRNAASESVRSADPQASRAADETVTTGSRATDMPAAEAELETTLRAAEDYAEALGDRQRIGKELAEYDRAIQRAEAYAKALRAGAACGIA